MSKQLTVAAAVSVVTMALFAVSTSFDGTAFRPLSEKGAAIGIATPIVSIELPAIPTLDFLR